MNCWLSKTQPTCNTKSRVALVLAKKPSAHGLQKLMKNWKEYQTLPNWGTGQRPTRGYKSQEAIYSLCLVNSNTEIKKRRWKNVCCW